MYERHENEQYFFDDGTVTHLADFVQRYNTPCCLCAPSLGKAVAERGMEIAVLDIDERFNSVLGFEKYDVYRPHFIKSKFDLIVCDPPFFNVSLSQLFSAIRLLAHHDFTQPLLVSYLSRRANAIEGAFSPFGLKATGYCPGYRTVRKIEKNEIQFFSNLGTEDLKVLLAEERNDSE